MKAFKKFSILILIVLVILTIVIFLPKKIDNNTYYKNLKELNYSISYKDAFPNEMLRYVVLTCVVDNVCNNIDEELKNSDPNTYDNKSKSYIYFNENRQYYVNKFKTKENEIINKADLDKIRMIYFKSSSNKISSLRGIEYLSNLTMFYANNFIGTDINLKFNQNLEYFKLYGSGSNVACSINIDNTYKLRTFVFNIVSPSPRPTNSNNLNFSNNPNLEKLQISACNYINFNLTANYNLKYLDLSGNKINSINLDNNSLLEEINLNNNMINTFAVNNKYNLKKLHVAGNDMYKIYLNNMPNLEDLNVNLNNLNSLNLPLVPKLKKLMMGGNYINDIDLSALTELEEFNTYGSANKAMINNINFTNNHKLRKINMSTVNLNNLNLSNNPNLEYLGLWNNKNLNSLNLDNNHNLKQLELSGNLFNYINLNNNTKLEKVSIQNHNLTNLNLWNNTKLESLNLTNNKLTSLNLSNNNLLNNIDVKNNNINDLRLNPENLVTIDASNNNLNSLDLTRAAKLSMVVLNNNKLNSLDVSASSKIGKLHVHNNNLTSLIINNINNLVYDCSMINYENNKLIEVKNTRCLSKNQNIDIEVLKNKKVNIPIKYAEYRNNYYYGELSENNEIFQKLQGIQNYKFKKLGTYNIDFNLYYKIYGTSVNHPNGKGGTVNVTVKAGEEDSYNPIVNKLVVKEGYPANFTEETYKNAITNLPANIKKFSVNVNQLNTSIPGIQNIVATLTFNDDTEKEVLIPVEVEELTKDNYIPTIKNVSVQRTANITDEEYKKMITNLPNNIQRVDIVQRADTNTVGTQEAILNVVLRNGQIKEVKIPIKVSAIMAETFEPMYKDGINYIGNYYTIRHYNIANLPIGANYKILNADNTEMSYNDLQQIISTKGIKNLKIRIIFPDHSSKDYIMPVKIYEKKEVIQEYATFTPKNEEHLESNNNKIDIRVNQNPHLNNYCNHETYTCYEYRVKQTYYQATNIDGDISGPKGGLWFDKNFASSKAMINPSRFNPGASVIPQKPWDPSYENPNWAKGEEKRVVEITSDYNGVKTKVQTITILRDTDGDGIPDVDDDDDDNDGISDAQELVDGTDSKDKNDFKVTKICYKVRG